MNIHCTLSVGSFQLGTFQLRTSNVEILYVPIAYRVLWNGALGKVEGDIKSKFKNDSNTVWNSAPQSIRECVSLYLAKSEIKKFVKTLHL